MVRVIVKDKNIDEEISFKGEVSLLADRYGYSLQEVIFKVNGKIVPDDYELSGEETVEIIRVVYAG